VRVISWLAGAHDRRPAESRECAKPADAHWVVTVATRYRRLRVLYRWLEEEEEIPASPMAGMKPPIVPDQPVPIVPEDGLRRLLAACAGKDFEVASWPTTSDLGLTDGTRQMLEDLLRLGDQLTEDPERASPGQVATQSWPSRHSEADGQGSTREPASMSGADHVRLRERLDQAAQRCNRARPGYPPALFNLHATGTGSDDNQIRFTIRGHAGRHLPS
jgi:hypothetical protein